MPLTQSELELIEQGLVLAVSAVLQAVRSSGHQAPIDWSSIRITETPEMARAKARQSSAPAAGAHE